MGLIIACYKSCKYFSIICIGCVLQIRSADDVFAGQYLCSFEKRFQLIVLNRIENRVKVKWEIE